MKVPRSIHTCKHVCVIYNSVSTIRISSFVPNWWITSTRTNKTKWYECAVYPAKHRYISIKTLALHSIKSFTCIECNFIHDNLFTNAFFAKDCHHFVPTSTCWGMITNLAPPIDWTSQHTVTIFDLTLMQGIYCKCFLQKTSASDDESMA